MKKKYPGQPTAAPSPRRKGAFLIGLAVITFLFFRFEGEVKVSWSSPSSAAHHQIDGEFTPPHNVFTGHESIEECNVVAIVHPRSTIIGCEGYWAPYSPITPIASPFSKFDATIFKGPFCGEFEWLRRLEWIEKAAGEDERMDYSPSGLHIERQRGLTTSRVDGKLLGNKEFRDYYALTDKYLSAGKAHDHETKLFDGEHSFVIIKQRMAYLPDETVCWTGDFASYYVRKYHAVPSMEFYGYVNAKYTLLHAQSE